MKRVLILLLFSLSLVGITACSQVTSTTSVDVGQEEKEQTNTDTEPAKGTSNGTEKKEEVTVGNEVKEPQPTKEPAQNNPQVPEHPPFEYPDAVRGIYSTSHSAGGERFASLLELVNSTDLNAMVIDIKDDNGYITFRLEGEMEPYSKNFIKDPKALIQTLSDHKIYPIARVVVFKDSVLAAEKPELSFKQDGQVWKNRRGEAFVNPFVKEVWDHNIRIAKEAAKLGFQEIQFDYVRFPEGFEKRDKILTYSMGDYTAEKLQPRLVEEWTKKKEAWEAEHKELIAQERESKQPSEAVGGTSAIPVTTAGESDIQSTDSVSPDSAVLPAPPADPVYDDVAARVTAVTDFVSYAKKELEPFDVEVSVDIFGYTATLPEAPGIGQNFTLISEHVDVISSMIYPSHWGPGYFNIAKPDLEPFRLVQEYVKTEQKKFSEMENPPISRPWLQDFTAPWLGKGNYVSYGKKEVEDQIRALNEAGIKEFLLWNAGNRYSENVDYTP
jgi:hypothetical protein